MSQLSAFPMPKLQHLGGPLARRSPGANSAVPAPIRRSPSAKSFWRSPYLGGSLAHYVQQHYRGGTYSSKTRPCGNYQVIFHLPAFVPNTGLFPAAGKAPIQCHVDNDACYDRGSSFRLKWTISWTTGLLNPISYETGHFSA